MRACWVRMFSHFVFCVSLDLRSTLQNFWISQSVTSRPCVASQSCVATIAATGRSGQTAVTSSCWRAISRTVTVCR